MQRKNLKRHLGTIAIIAVALVGTSLTTACAPRHVAGGLMGGAAVGGAYEYKNKRALDRLERQRANRSISDREYQRRRQEIDDRSLIY
ncbi:MAG: hypothetical protein U5R46_14455 [Gammaproteobacteria bacterium]|nr:hypothetical protein [Gammaproteobacteria bacterium]